MNSKIIRFIPNFVQLFFWSVLLLLLVNLCFRIALFFLNFQLTANASYSDIVYTLFNIGLRFDLYISLIILLIPFLISAIPFLFIKRSKPFLIISNWLIIVLGVVNISISASDLGFFKYYNARITKTIFDWTNEMGVMLKVMVNDTNYLKYFFIFIAISLVYVFLQVKILKKVNASPSKFYPIKYRLAIFMGMLILIFFNIRGSFNFNNAPSNIDDAFHSDNLFLNQLSLNPVYNLGHSYSDVPIEYFKNEDEYVNAALAYLNREKSERENPFETQIPGSDSLRPNIILIFLESMSNSMVSRYHPSLKTTPFLDSLAKKGIVFDNFYSAGVHTHNGITSTLYGLPAVMNNKPMNELATADMIFYGMPWILKEKGYTNSFYVTGSKKFDNMDDFLSLNGFDKVIGENDYPKDSIYNSWGVTDKVMFNRVLNDCDSLYETETNFFKSILTISAHEGYVVPEQYQSRLTNTKQPNDIYELSDLMLGEFIKAAKKKAWFEETIFIIVGDHGQNFSTAFDLNLNYHTVPLILYAPKYFQHSVYNDPGLQQDIYPTLFSLLDLSHTNNGLGVDLFSLERDFGYFNADTKLGVIDEDYFLIYRGRNKTSLFYLQSEPTKDIYPDNKTKATEMMKYGFSMIQSAKYLIDNKLTNITSTDLDNPDRFIAHAGGRIGGHEYTNSLEALETSYQKGFKLFELDILKTSDNYYVAAHDWKTWQQMTGFSGQLPPSLQEFKQHKLLNIYSPMDMDDINDWFQNHPDAILVTDKVNEPAEFSGAFIDTERLMMELFTLESLTEASRLNIKSAMPTWDVLKELDDNIVGSLIDLGVTDIAASRNVIADNIPLLKRLKNRGIKVYVFHVNSEEGKDEAYVLCNEMDYIYGMYADDFDFNVKVDCD